MALEKPQPDQLTTDDPKNGSSRNCGKREDADVAAVAAAARLSRATAKSSRVSGAMLGPGWARWHLPHRLNAILEEARKAGLAGILRTETRGWRRRSARDSGTRSPSPRR